MTSRLTAIALSVAVLATASLAFATSGDRTGLAQSGLQSATQSLPVLQLERVVVTAKRLPQ